MKLWPEEIESLKDYKKIRYAWANGQREFSEEEFGDVMVFIDVLVTNFMDEHDQMCLATEEGIEVKERRK